MGGGKVELKRIEDKSSRQVSFTKRRNGLMKKSHELSVMCDVDLALFVFAARGKLYEFSTGESMTKVLNRYQDYKNAEELIRTAVHQHESLSENRNVRTADELTEIVQRHIEGENINKHDINGLIQLEQQLHTSLQQVRMKKTQLMMGNVKALQEKEIELKKEKIFMKQEIMAARSNGMKEDDGNQPHNFP